MSGNTRTQSVHDRRAPRCGPTQPRVLGTSSLHFIRAAAMCAAGAGAAPLPTTRASWLAPAPVAGRYYVTDRLPRNTVGRRWVRPAKKLAAFVPSSSAVVDRCHFSLDFLYVPPATPCQTSGCSTTAAGRATNSASHGPACLSKDERMILTRGFSLI